jgi:DNA-binding protein HU-beta
MTARTTRTTSKTRTAAAKKAAPAKKTAAKTSAKKPAPRLSTDTDKIPTDPAELRTLIKITRDRRWRAGRRGDVELVAAMSAKLEALTGKKSEPTPAKKTPAKRASKTTARTPVKRSTAAAKRTTSKRASK